jgi:glucose/mannose transport system permease protein
MPRRFVLRMPNLFLAAALMLAGAVSILILNRTKLDILGINFTSIGLLLGGLIFYCGVLVIVAMFKDETYLSIGLLLPSIVAIAIFVYGFIGWSVRVSLSKWKGLLPDYTWDGLQQYTYLFHDPRFLIDVRNTAVFTVGFISGCLLLGLGLAILLDQRLKGEAVFRGIFLFPMSISFIASGVVWGWLMNPATGDRITGINLIFQSLHLDFLISLWHSSPQPWGMAFTVIPAVWQL